MKNGVKRNHNGYRIGQSHQNAKFTDHEIELARQMHREGWKLVDIAAKLEMSVSYVSYIVRHVFR